MIDLYAVLGVASNATIDQIRSAYRKAAAMYHPDRNKEKGADAKFKEIGRAYEILSDDQKRGQYDALRNRPYSPPNPADPRSYQSGWGGKASKSPGHTPNTNTSTTNTSGDPFTAWANAFHSDFFAKMVDAADDHKGKKPKCAVCKNKKIITVHLGLFVMGMPCPICAAFIDP